MSYVINLKRFLYTFKFRTELEDDRIRNITEDFLAIAARVKGRSIECHVMLYEFRDLAFDLCDVSVLLESCKPSSRELWRAEFLSMAVYFGLWEFVDESLRDYKELLRVLSRLPLLGVALGLHKLVSFRVRTYQLSSTIVHVLLRHGADLNEPFAISTLWQCFLRKIYSAIGSFEEKSWLNYFKIL
jgi:hypothetical protein